MRDKELQMGGPSVGGGALFLPCPPEALEGTRMQQGYEKQWCLLSVPTGWGPETASQRLPGPQSGVGIEFFVALAEVQGLTQSLSWRHPG